MSNLPLSQSWHRLTVDQAVAQLGVAPTNGLDTTEAARRLVLVELPFKGWLFCILVASLTLWVSEGYKLIARRYK